MPKPYTIIEYNGQQARRYEDGAIRNERGHLLAPHPAGHTITQADASTLSAQRHEQAREAVRQRMLAEWQSFRANIAAPADVWADIVTKQAQTLYESDKPALDDVQRLGQIMDMLPGKQAVAQSPAPGAQADDVVLLLLRRRVMAGDVVDAEYTE